eukprot:5428050-Prymnesium_polylepis.1
MSSSTVHFIRFVDEVLESRLSLSSSGSKALYLAWRGGESASEGAAGDATRRQHTPPAFRAGRCDQ